MDYNLSVGRQSRGLGFTVCCNRSMRSKCYQTKINAKRWWRTTFVINLFSWKQILMQIHHSSIRRHSTMESMNIQVHRIKMPDYEQHHYDKELLRQSGEYLLQLFVIAAICEGIPSLILIEGDMTLEAEATWHNFLLLCRCLFFDRIYSITHSTAIFVLFLMSDRKLFIIW